jgi:hypothetical protein
MLERTTSRWWTLAGRICKLVKSVYSNKVKLIYIRKSLTDLDLHSNHLLEVRSLHHLLRLEHLNLGMFDNL